MRVYGSPACIAALDEVQKGFHLWNEARTEAEGNAAAGVIQAGMNHLVMPRATTSGRATTTNWPKCRFKPALDRSPDRTSASALAPESVDANVVLPEPVAEAPVRDADCPERLLVGLDRRRERILDVLEQNLAADDRSAVPLVR
jgi:hypothetical protein